MDLSVLPQNHPSVPLHCPKHIPQPLRNACIPACLCQSSSCCPAKPPQGRGPPLLPRGAPCPREGLCSPSARLCSGQQCWMCFQGNRQAAGTGMGTPRAGHGSRADVPTLQTHPSTPDPRDSGCFPELQHPRCCFLELQYPSCYFPKLQYPRCCFT